MNGQPNEPLHPARHCNDCGPASRAARAVADRNADGSGRHELCRRRPRRRAPPDGGGDRCAGAAPPAETGRPALDARVLDAMRKVPRHEFVPGVQKRAAYRNRPLPIGAGQTISQPYIVALMTDLLRARARTTRCSRSAPAAATRRRCWPSWRREVYTIEIVDSLGAQAAQTLGAARLCQRRRAHRRRLQGLAGAGAVRRHHRHRRARPHSAGADRAAEAGRPPGHPGRHAVAGADGRAQERGRHARSTSRSCRCASCR